ncbi:MAG: gliding motility-associated C-terminal domain-containing protein, partial [Bacteroidales bacterium]|nr:gliding motility-associated C-terminal domain-containing protein [Bacteroidales bacterium]
FKYEFFCEPHSDPSQIAFVYDGVKNISLLKGNLIVKNDINTVIEFKPYAYQRIDGRKVRVECDYVNKRNRVWFKIDKNYNPDYPLIIDPIVRVFASYSGSTADNWGYSATYDNDGYLYAGGNAFGIGYPTTSAYQLNYGGGSCDIVISKYDTTGSFMLYSTYLGGSGTEVPHSLITNSLNELYVLATTSSLNFPVTPGAFDGTFNGGNPYILTYVLNYTNGSDIAVSKFSADGTQLLASTYVGGSANDGLNTFAPLRYNYADDVRGEIVLDNNENVIVVSCTFSTNFPVTAGAYQTSHAGGQDACLFKLDNQLSTMIWGTLFGGSVHDAAYSVVTKDNDEIYLAGGTTSGNLPVTPGTLYSANQGGADGWIAKFSANGNQLLASTYFGSPSYDQIYFVDLDRYGNVYVLGQTEEPGTYFVQNATWFTASGGQFITKMNPALSNIVWSTAFGNGTVVPDISPTAFMVDLCNNIYLSGWGGNVNGFGTTTGLPITVDAFQSTTDGSDYYFLVIKDDGSGITYGSFYGGSISDEHVDGGTSRFDKKGRIYQMVCAGCGGHSDFPTSPGAWSNTNNSSNCNNGVVKFDFNLPVLVADFINPPSICAPDTVHFFNLSLIHNPSNTNYFWDFGDGTTSTQISPTHLYTIPGVYLVTLIVTDPLSCNYSDTLTRQVLVLKGGRDTLPDVEICLGDFAQIGILPVNDPTISYHWIPGTSLSNTTISNPIANPVSTISYNLYVSNALCADTLEQKVIVYDLQVDAGDSVLACLSNVTLTAVSSNANVSFFWAETSAFSTMLNLSPNDSTANIVLTTPKYYYVKIDNGVCQAVDSVWVDRKITTIGIVTTGPTCFGDCDGTITVMMSGGTPPMTYVWSSSSSTTNTATGLCSGAHTVTATDAMGCEGIETITLLDPPRLESDPKAKNAPCEEVCIGKAWVNAQGGTPPYTYLWDDPGAQTNDPASALCPGIFIARTTDSNGCVRFDTIEVIDSSIYVNISVTASRDTVFEGQSTQLNVTNLGPGYTYEWTPTTYLDDPFIHNPKANPLAPITYYVIVRDQYGCVWIDSILIMVIEVFCDWPYIFVPNAFSPNGDGINDVLYVRSIYAEEVYFVVFNRWGEKVFETNDITIGWDGTYKGRDADPGVFDYYLEVKCFNQVYFKKKGNITLIR